jgi:ribosomal protein S18 acetylase RimI-like enzyme
MVRELRSDAELLVCLALDHSYKTDSVWQMDVRGESDGLTVRFRTMRLPRTMQVPYPRDRSALAESWQKRDCFLVAAVEDIVLGYVNMRVDVIPAQGWILDLVVGEPFRRRRIGSALMEQAVRWARLHKIDRLTLEVPTKNYPGIKFAEMHGFSFCGYNDHYYAMQDIALFFGKPV